MMRHTGLRLVHYKNHVRVQLSGFHQLWCACSSYEHVLANWNLLAGCQLVASRHFRSGCPGRMWSEDSGGGGGGGGIGNEYSRLLYTRLSLQPEYQFLDPSRKDANAAISGAGGGEEISRRLVSLLQTSEAQHIEPPALQQLHTEMLNTFQDWARGAQLRVGFLMHLDQRIHNKEFITRLIAHMATENLHDLAPHELVALLLLIYFRKESTLVELADILDLGELQTVFARRIQAKELRMEEICAGCLGIKKIKDFSVNSQVLRHALYNMLNVQEADLELKDFFIMTVLMTLAKGNHVYHDPLPLVKRGLVSMRSTAQTVSLMTAIKMVTFGIPTGCEDPELTRIVLKRLDEHTHLLNIKDILSLTEFLSKTHGDHTKLLIKLSRALTVLYHQATTFSEIADVLSCLTNLAYCSLYNLEISAHIFAALQNIQGADEVGALALQVAECLAATHSKAQALKASLPSIVAVPSYAGTLCRVPAFLAVSMKLDGAEQRPGTPEMDLSLAGSILALFNKRLPLELFSPQMKVNHKKLDNRSRLLVNCYRGLLKLLGDEAYARPVRILPHFPEPDILFGHISGLPVSVPAYFSDPSIVRPKKAPLGDWYVLVMAIRKTLNEDQEVVGKEELKVRQLRKLGFNPIVIPYSALVSAEETHKAIISILKLNSVTLPNLDDGYLEKNKKF